MKVIYSGSDSWPSGIHPSAQLICKGRRGAPDRENAVISRGQARRGKGVVSLPSSRPAEAAAGRNVNGCFPPCLCESQKNKVSNFRRQETNFCGAYDRFQLPSGAPFPRFANLEEQSLASGFLGTNQIPQKGTCSYGRWGLPFKALWPVVTITEAKAENSKGGRTLQAQVRYLRVSKSTWRRLLLKVLHIHVRTQTSERCIITSIISFQP